jgi:hypothetical protein
MMGRGAFGNEDINMKLRLESFRELMDARQPKLGTHALSSAGFLRQIDKKQGCRDCSPAPPDHTSL